MYTYIFNFILIVSEINLLLVIHLLIHVDNFRICKITEQTEIVPPYTVELITDSLFCVYIYVYHVRMYQW